MANTIMEVRKLDVDKNSADMTAKARRVNAYKKSVALGTFAYEADDADLVPMIHKTIQKPIYTNVSEKNDTTESESMAHEEEMTHKVVVKIDKQEKVSKVAEVPEVAAVETEPEEKVEIEEMRIPDAAARAVVMPTVARSTPGIDRSWLWLQGTLLVVATVLTLAMLGLEQNILFTEAGMETHLQFSWPQMTDRLTNMSSQLFAHVLGS